eukprot:scaffold1916_cov118-Cylindrotheca_fusiformis.AAC.2
MQMDMVRIKATSRYEGEVVRKVICEPLMSGRIRDHLVRIYEWQYADGVECHEGSARIMRGYKVQVVKYNSFTKPCYNAENELSSHS